MPINSSPAPARLYKVRHTGTPFDILLNSRIDGDPKRVAEISFYTGEAPPDHLINNPTLGRYPIVQTPLEAFRGFVDVR